MKPIADVAFIPESAPFNPTQRAWLNGFYTGLLGLEDDSHPAPTDRNGQQGSAPATGDEAEMFPWHDPTLPIDRRLELADDRPIERRLMAAMAQLDCGACGYVCKTYAEALACSAENDTKLCRPGSRDTARTLKQLLADRGIDRSSGPTCELTVQSTSPGPARKSDARTDAVPARFVRAAKLNRQGSDKDTRHVVLDIAGTGLTYEPGDSLAVVPTNCPELVDRIIQASGLSPSHTVCTPTGLYTSLQEALLRHCVINRVDEDVLTSFAAAARDPEDLTLLRNLAAGNAETSEMDLLDLFQRFPSARPDPEALVHALTSLRPRLYSIASSQRLHPEEVHLTVGVVRYEHEGRRRKGVASTMLAERLSVSENVQVAVHVAPHFRLPDDPSTPIIMIGPGTGIAPFRAFLQERQARSASGPNWLFFGDRRRRCDFLYDHELEVMHADGLLTRLDTAFSRDQPERLYVQHRMIEHGGEIWRWLERDAHVYVCGDARRMARDVDRALREIVAEHGRMDAKDADRYLTRLSQAGRYAKDVY